MAEPLLQIEGLSKRFGGVIAADAITLDLPPGEFHAVIGPNGAGKTTLIGLIAGEVAPQQGRVRFDGTDITRLAAYRRSQARARALVPDHLALFRVHGARQCRPCRAGASRPLVSLLARRAPRGGIARAGAGGACPCRPAQRAGVRVARLSHGEHRQLEIAMALVAEPRLLLLDEPMAGMGPEESARMVEMLRQLKGSMTVLLIEHDMEAVFALADRLTVLVYGRIIASGDPEAVRADAAVRQAYLGEKDGAQQGGRHG